MIDSVNHSFSLNDQRAYCQGDRMSYHIVNINILITYSVYQKPLDWLIIKQPLKAMIAPHQIV